MRLSHLNISVALLLVSSCEIGRTALSFEALRVCVVPDAGQPELGEAFTVRAGPGLNLDAGCTTVIDGGQLVITVSGVDVMYFPGDESPSPDITCEVAPLAPGRYVVRQQTGASFFDVPSADAGFPRCAN